MMVVFTAYGRSLVQLNGLTPKRTGGPESFGVGLVFGGCASSLGEFDRLPALKWLRGFIGQQLGFQPVLKRGTQRCALRNDSDERTQGLVIALFDSLKPACIQAVFQDF